MDKKNYKAIIESILFTMGESVELSKIAAAIELDKDKTQKLLNELIEDYANAERGIAVMELDGAYQMCTKPEMYEYLIRIAKQPKHRALTDVLLETLSIIAYKQPITKCYNCLEKCNPAKVPYCITKALIAAVKGDMQNGLVFCGANVGHINRITTVHELMSELVGA